MADLEEIARKAFAVVWRTGVVGAEEGFFAPSVAARVRQQVGFIREGFPDFAPEIESVTVSGETAAIRWVGRGTHQGRFAGLAATNKSIEVSGVSIYQFRGETVVDRRTLWDMLSLLQQLNDSA